MSCFFQIGDDDVWNSANLIARTFHAEALTLAQIFGVPSGLEPIVDDECHIESRDFTLFIETLMHEYQRTNHTVLRSLLEGVIGVGLVLLERMREGDEAPLQGIGDFWEEKHQTLSRAMPRG
ncbi:DUF6086 family protein [Streptomyces radiopugnans]|uniref:DUF6086 family protein n=1 Tax=Streptomyces radiopugnans TaxID=403935 RepID=UPI003F1C9699